MEKPVRLKRRKGAILRSIRAGAEWSGYMTRADLEREERASKERKQKASAAREMGLH